MSGSLALLFALLACSPIRRTTLQRQLAHIAARFDAAGLRARASFGALDPLQASRVELVELRARWKRLRKRRQDELDRRARGRDRPARAGGALRAGAFAAPTMPSGSGISSRPRAFFAALEEPARLCRARAGRPHRRVVAAHPSRRPRRRACRSVRAHLEGRTARLDSEHRLRHRDGSWRWVNARAKLVRDAAGEPSGWWVW